MRLSALSRSFPCLRMVRYLLLGMLLTPVLMYGQTKPITGTVLDDAGKPLPGVSVTIRGNVQGTETNDAGKFTINAPSGAMLIFSSVGYENQRITVGNTMELTVTLRSTTNALNDVVVTGYRTVKRRDVTGSIGSAPIKDMLKAPTPNITDMLEGRVAGVTVSSNDGQPGALPNIVIRGNNSITGDNTPLYVIDGFIIENPNSATLNPEDIESMDILKDASATAIYGARGSNGVIVITTKKGKIGAPVINFGISYGTQKDKKFLPMMSPYQYVSYLEERDSLNNNWVTYTNNAVNVGGKFQYPGPYSGQYVGYNTAYFYGGAISALNPTTGSYSLDTNYFPSLAKFQSVKGVDMQRAFYGANAPMQNYDLSISGGTDKTRYYISGNIFDQNGIMVNSGYKRYVGRVVLDQTVNDKLKMGVNVNYSYIDLSGGSPLPNSLVPNTTGSTSAGGNATYAPNYNVYGNSPTAPLDKNGNQLYDILGSTVNYSTYDQTSNAGRSTINAYIDQKNKYLHNLTNNLAANAYAEYKILKSLTFRISGGITSNSLKTVQFYDSLTSRGSPYTATGSTNLTNGSIIYTTNNSWINTNQLTYDKTFTGGHHFSMIGVAEFSGARLSNYGLSANQLPNPALGVNGLSQGSPLPIVSTNSSSRVASFVGIANYDFKGKYFLTANFRADGSTKFAPANRWGYFPSGAVKWRFTEEDFLKWATTILSDGTLGVSYGVTGNNRGIGDFPYLSQLGTSNTGANSYVFNSANGVAIGEYPINLANPNLKWESTAQTDIGLNLGFLKNRILFTADVYRKITSNLLLGAPLPASLGFPTINANVGKVQNQGLELSFTTVNIQPSKPDGFMWTSSFNISWNQSKVLQLAQGVESMTSTVNWTSGFGGLNAYMTKVGQPLGQMYGLAFDGLYQYDDFNYTTAINPTAGSPGPGSHYVLKDNLPGNGNVAGRGAIQPGDIKFKDVNGDGKIDANDFTVIGRGLPIHTGGFGNNFSFKGFSLNVFFQWSYGNNIQNAYRMIFEGNLNSTVTNNINQFASYANRWEPDHTNTNIPRIGGAGPAFYSSRTVEDGSYLRLKTVNLGYNLPASVLNRAKIKAITIYVSAQNLVTWTRYSGQDPEINSYNNVLTPGFDWSAYPRARTMTVGANITF